MSISIRSYFEQFGQIDYVCYREKENIPLGFMQFQRQSSTVEILKATQHECNEMLINVKKPNMWPLPPLLQIGSNMPLLDETMGEEQLPLCSDMEPRSTPEGFDILNDDCILQIFQRVRLIDLCSAADVCVRFKDLAKSVFSKQYKQLNITRDLGSDRHIASLARNFGSSFNSVTFDKCYIISDKAINLLSKYCTESLQTMHFHFVPEEVSNTNHFRTLLANLKVVRFHSYPLSDISLESLGACTNLEKLEIYSTCHESWMRYCFPRLKEFKLNLGIHEDSDLMPLNRFLANNQTIKILSADFYYPLPAFFEGISEYLPKLESLDFLMSKKFENKHTGRFLKLSNLNCLNTLVISGKNIPIIELIRALVTKKVPIKKFGFYIWDGINSNVVDSIVNLGQLESLELLGLTIGDASRMIQLVQNLPKLKKLKLGRVSGCGLAIIGKFIPHCKQLTYLCIRVDSLKINESDYKSIMAMVSGYHENNGFVLKLIGSKSKYQCSVPSTTIRANRKYFYFEPVNDSYYYSDDSSDYDSDGF